MVLAKIEPMTAGTIRKLNTSSTPAVVTELATTRPKETKKTKSHIRTVSKPREAVSRSPARLTSGPRANQWKMPIAA